MRRQGLVFIFLLLACSFVSAQQYPAKPVRVVIPYPPGSTPDIVGRTLSMKLQEALAQPFVVENRTGAGGNIGAEAVAKSPADGYTLLIGINGPAAINKFLYKNLGYDSDKDLLPISLLASAPQMLVVTPSVEANDFKTFLGLVKKNPGRLSYASVGSGSASHLTWRPPRDTPIRLVTKHSWQRGLECKTCGTPGDVCSGTKPPTHLILST